MSSSSSEDLDRDLDSDVVFSTDLGSTIPTHEDELTQGGTSAANYDGDTTQQREDEFNTSSGVHLHTGQGKEEDDIAIALPPTESDGAGEYHEVALTGSAALDVLDQVSL